jgi:long-chain acyl-CoA synthetase
MEKIILTGITGLVGSAFATELLKHDKNVEIIALTRGQGNKDAQARVKDSIREQCEFDGTPEFEQEAMSRISVIKRNIASPIPSSRIDSLEGVDVVFHCAADVNLGKDPYGKTYINNYQGTKNLLKIAKRLNVKAFHQVSTAYVAGKNPGVVYEDTPRENPVFNNSYEKSKYNAERLVRESGIPYTIYRPSIIVGNLKDGRIRRPLAFYRILEFFAKMKKQQCAKQGLQPYEPINLTMHLQAHSSNKIYFVPIDYVQKTISDLFLLSPSNKTYHITGKNPGSLDDIADISRSLLKIDGLKVVKKAFKLSIKEKLVHKFLGDLMPYFSTEITFDTKNVADALGEDRLNWKIDYSALYIVIKEYFDNMFPEIIGPE